MSPRARWTLLALGAAGATLAAAALVPRGQAPLAETPEALARGERVFRDKCLHCHADVPIARRLAGWSPERAYDAIGRLPDLFPAMSEFNGTDEERRALAVYLAAMGGDRLRRD